MVSIFLVNVYVLAHIHTHTLLCSAVCVCWISASPGLQNLPAEEPVAGYTLNQLFWGLAYIHATLINTSNSYQIKKIENLWRMKYQYADIK